MPVYRLDQRLLFPPASRAEAGGLLAVGGDLRPERLLLGYRSGIFPWYSEGQPIWWHSPNPRFVLDPSALHIPRSLRKVIRRRDYEIRLDTAFLQVIEACAKQPRPGQSGTWITAGMVAAYLELHRQGVAHSAEAWRDGQLVGGLYGVSLGDVYFGESMFAHAPDASKCVFAVLVRWLAAQGIALIDSQVHTDHLERFGAENWPRDRYLARLSEIVGRPTRLGPWSLAPDDPAFDL